MSMRYSNEKKEQQKMRKESWRDTFEKELRGLFEEHYRGKKKKKQ